VTRLTHVVFDTNDAASGPMTWAQEHIWRPLTRMPEISSDFNIKRVMAVPGLPVPVVLESLRLLVERHQALRTLFVDHHDGPQQHVQGSGEYLVDVVEEAEADTIAAGEAAVERLAATAFDLEKELPARFAIVTCDGLVHALAMVTAHVACDGWATGLLLAELRDSLGGRRPQGPVEWRPLDQAAFENSPSGKRRGEQSLTYWRRQLSAAPIRLFDGPPLPVDDMPIRRWHLESSAIAVAARRLAAKSGTSTSVVMLAATALVLWTIAGKDAVLLQLISTNRPTPRQRGLVSASAQDGLLLFRPADTVDATIQRMKRESTAAYHHAKYRPAYREDLVEEVGRERGREVELSAYFNDGRLDPEPAPPAEITPDALAGLRANSDLAPLTSLPTHSMSFYVMVRSASTPERFALSLLMDIRRVPEEVCRQVLPGMEALLCDALFRTVGVDEVAAVTGLVACSGKPGEVRQ
jgi:hypothetical protein